MAEQAQLCLSVPSSLNRDLLDECINEGFPLLFGFPSVGGQIADCELDFVF